MFNVMFIIVFIIVICGIITTFVTGISQWHKNNQSPVLNVHAVVCDKRVVEDSHMGADNMMFYDETYYVTFRFDSGDTSEFVVGHGEYNQLSVGTAGTLYFQGTRYLRFE